MKISNVEIFDNYLSGTLTGKSKNNFEQKLQDSKSFRTSFEAYKAAYQALKEEPKWTQINNLVDNFRDEIAAEKDGYFKAYQEGGLSHEEKEIFEQDLKDDVLLNYEFEKFNTPQKFVAQVTEPVQEAKIVSFRTSTIYRVLSIAAMFVLAVGAFWWVNQTNLSNNDELFAAHFEAPNTNVVKMDWTVKDPDATIPNSQLLQIKQEAIQHFEAGNWHETIERLENYVKNSQRTDDTYYLMVYSGVSYMELGLYDKAIETLTFSMENIKDEVNNSRRKETVQWYLALANLKNGNDAKFLELTQALTKGTNKKVKEKAIQILNEYQAENSAK